MLVVAEGAKVFTLCKTVQVPEKKTIKYSSKVFVLGYLDIPLIESLIWALWPEAFRFKTVRVKIIVCVVGPGVCLWLGFVLPGATWGCADGSGSL